MCVYHLGSEEMEAVPVRCPAHYYCNGQLWNTVSPTKESQSALIQRWVCEMEGFQCTVRYRKGAENIADYLSRQGDYTAVVTTRGAHKAQRVDYRALSKGRQETQRRCFSHPRTTQGFTP